MWSPGPSWPASSTLSTVRSECNVLFNWLDLLAYWCHNILNNGSVLSWLSVIWWTGKGVGFSGCMLRFNTGNKGDLQQEPLLQNEKHVDFYQHKPVL